MNLLFNVPGTLDLDCLIPTCNVLVAEIELMVEERIEKSLFIYASSYQAVIISLSRIDLFTPIMTPYNLERTARIDVRRHVNVALAKNTCFCRHQPDWPCELACILTSALSRLCSIRRVRSSWHYAGKPLHPTFVSRSFTVDNSRLSRPLSST